jgi:hypothetical protein
MAKMRIINTRFWIDDYVSNLDPTEKLLFLYFLTSPQTDICGVYEVPLKVVATETGIDRDMVEKIIKRFSKDGRIFYKNGWVAIKNFKKHQSLNPKVERGIEIGLSKAPVELVRLIDDSLSKPMDSLSHPNSNSNLNSNPNTATAKPSAVKQPKYTPIGAEIIKAFEAVDSKNKTYYSNTTQRGACDFLIAEHGLEKVLGVVAVLPQINQMKLYLAQITTPYELKENWVKLGNKMKSKENEHNEKLNNVVW